MAVIATGECYQVLQSDTGKLVIQGIGERSDIWRFITAEETGRFAGFREPPGHDRDHYLVDATCRKILGEFFAKDRV